MRAVNGAVLTAQLERGARHRLAVIGLPHQHINPFVDLVFKWVENNGPEWTATRLKALKLFLIRNAAGLDTELPWVRKNRKGQPYGILGSILSWCERCTNVAKSRKRFNAILQSLNISTLFVSEVATKQQMDKFMAGVNCEAPHGVSVDFLQEYSLFVSGLINRKQVVRGGNSLMGYRGSPNKRSPLPHSELTIPQSEDILAEMRWYLLGKENMSFIVKHERLYAPVFDGISLPLDPDRYYDHPVDPHAYGGVVHFLQEPGMKMRAIASPYRLHQLASKPIGDAIYRVVKEMPWDCTYDQSRALPAISKSLIAGQTVHSVDLTGATDYFPLEIQLVTLRSVFGDIPDIKLVSDLSKIRFKSEFGDICWKRGQPLGLYPSFGMFTLTHGLILAFLLNKEWEGEFYVVGDDVVILDDLLFERYTSLLATMQCPWSPSKSLSSNLLAEFAGKIITREAVVPSYKWRKMSNDNFLDVCRNLGPKSAVLLTRAQKKVFDAVKGLMYPIGLNFSYPGSNLEKMMKDTDAFLNGCEERAMSSLVDLIRVVNRNVYSCRPHQAFVLMPDRLEKLRQTFDEKVRSVFGQTVFHRLQSLWSLVANLPEALDLKPRLPPQDIEPSRVSTLVRYERLLFSKTKAE